MQTLCSVVHVHGFIDDAVRDLLEKKFLQVFTWTSWTWTCSWCDLSIHREKVENKIKCANFDSNTATFTREQLINEKINELCVFEHYWNLLSFCLRLNKVSISVFWPIFNSHPPIIWLIFPDPRLATLHTVFNDIICFVSIHAELITPTRR